MRYEADLCRLGCQHCIGHFNGISNSTPLSLCAQFGGQIALQLSELAECKQTHTHIDITQKSYIHFVINWWVEPAGNTATKETDLSDVAAPAHICHSSAVCSCSVFGRKNMKKKFFFKKTKNESIIARAPAPVSLIMRNYSSSHGAIASIH